MFVGVTSRKLLQELIVKDIDMHEAIKSFFILLFFIC